MLYQEFLAGTKAHENSNTFGQYETIEKIYMDCEDMTKEDAYRLWKQTYGKQEKLDRERTLKMVQEMSEYRDPHNPSGESVLTPRQAYLRRKLFQIGISLTDTNKWNMGFDSELTTPFDNVTYKLEKYRKINGHRVARLIIFYERERYETALIYLMSDLRISAEA